MMTGDVHALSGAYVLHALDARESELFRRHAAACEACSVEVAELCEAAARLADETWAAPPARLRGRVMSQVRRTRQDRPAGRGPRRMGMWWRHRSGMLVAACLTLAVALVATFLVQERRIREQGAEFAMIQQVLTAPDARIHRGAVQGGGHLSAVVSPGHNAAVVTATDLARLGPGDTYQLWLVDGTTAASAGILGAGRQRATIVVPDIGEARTLALTREPRGGSVVPTSPVLVQVPIK